MDIPHYQVDAFTRRMFSGNPAAVCPLPHWLDDALMQSIAAEHNLSETAFFVPQGDDFALRWFTPSTEVKLCGHATLASAHVLFHVLEHPRNTLVFHTHSGPLRVEKAADHLRMDLPAAPPQPTPIPDGLVEALGVAPQQVLAAEDYLVLLANEAQVRSLKPDFKGLMALDKRGVMVTAPGNQVDFVSRFFGPKAGIDEDPATGSAHCTLTPFWAERLGKTRLQARQLSARGGEFDCEWIQDRVIFRGHAVLYGSGQIQLSEVLA